MNDYNEKDQELTREMRQQDEYYEQGHGASEAGASADGALHHGNISHTIDGRQTPCDENSNHEENTTRINTTLQAAENVTEQQNLSHVGTHTPAKAENSGESIVEEWPENQGEQSCFCAQFFKNTLFQLLR